MHATSLLKRRHKRDQPYTQKRPAIYANSQALDMAQNAAYLAERLKDVRLECTV